MNPASPHLDLAELLADVNGDAENPQARGHLAACESCRAEARRWGTVADGVRDLVSATPDPDLAMSFLPRRGGLADRRWHARHAKLVTSAAAALVLLGGAGYGLTAALSGHATSPAASTRTAALTSVSGCAGLVQAAGTLQQLNGTSLVIQTSSGQSLTATTTSSTLLSQSWGTTSDITDGASVVVIGAESDGTIAADMVNVGTLGGKKLPPGGSGKQTTVTPPGLTTVQGTAADVTTGGFTVVESDGTQVPVTTSAQTRVVIPRATLSELQTGENTLVVGYAGPDGTLSATVVIQNRKPLAGGGKANITVNGCSPGSIDTAITTALVSAG
jgi:hypothetical protein